MRRKHRIRGTTQIAFIKMPLKSLTQIYGQGYCQFTLPAQKLPSHTLSVSFHPPDTLCKKQVHYSSFSKPFHIEFILTKNNLIVKPSIGTITKQHHSDVLFSSLIYFTNKKGTVKNCSDTFSNADASLYFSFLKTITIATALPSCTRTPKQSTGLFLRFAMSCSRPHLFYK